MASHKPITRSKYFLVGPSDGPIATSKLPSNGQVLSRYLELIEINKDKSATLSAVYQEVESFWRAARIPIRNKDKVIIKIYKLRERLSYLIKHKSYKNSAAQQKV